MIVFYHKKALIVVKNIYFIVSHVVNRRFVHPNLSIMKKPQSD